MEKEINILKLTFMKQSLLKKLWLRTSMLVAVILCGAGTAWGQTVAKIGDVTYETLEAAIAAAQDGETITLLADCAGNGIKAAQGKFTTGLTVDFAGHTYTVDGSTVGSTGTETNAFQLLKDNKITFKNGTITSEKAKILIQNYSDLTLEGMTLTLNNANYASAYTLSNNNGNVVIDGTTINATPAGGFAFDVCRYASYPSVNVTVKGESVINGNVEVSASGSDAKDGFKLMLEAGTLNGNIVLDASAKAAMAAAPEKVEITKSNAFDVAAPADYMWFDNGDGTSTLVPYVPVSTPIIFHDAGEYEDALTVAIAGEGTIMYKLNDGEATAYTAPITINATTTVTAWAEKDGVKSDEVSKKFTIKTAEAGPAVEDNYYTIKNYGNGKFVNVAGRKTVTFVDDATAAAGTVIRVKTNAEKAGQLEVIRSQGVDLPGYAEKAMNYVPKIVELAVEKLKAEGSGAILGEHGLDLIMEKFKESFDYHLYLENGTDGYRIYGRTPSMQPVVDFYAENKANVDAKLPQLEAFINSAIKKVLEKTGGRGRSILVDFKLHDVWQNMPGKLTEPTNEASTLKFYEEVLSSEKNVWDFAYQTGMLYWEKVKGYLTENAGSLGDYGKYLEKIPNVRPNFKYYIVPGENGVDIISEGNSQITDASTAWTLTKRDGFDVTLPVEKVVNIYPTSSGGTTTTYNEYYGTLYTDFAYQLPADVVAYKIDGIDVVKEKAYIKKTKLENILPAQTPVMLVSNTADIELTLVAGDVAAVSEGELRGNDFLINEYEINSSQAEGIMMILQKLSESLYNEYEHLQRRNAGTVNNKYFFGLAVDPDLGDAYKAKTGNEMEYSPVRVLTKKEDGTIAFTESWNTLAGNESFIFNEEYSDILLSRVGDVNRDGQVTIADVTALVNIVLGKATYPADADKYDFEVADVNTDKTITISDVTALVNIILGKTQN